MKLTLSEMKVIIQILENGILEDKFYRNSELLEEIEHGMTINGEYYDDANEFIEKLIIKLKGSML